LLEVLKQRLPHSDPRVNAHNPGPAMPGFDVLSSDGDEREVTNQAERESDIRMSFRRRLGRHRWVK